MNSIEKSVLSAGSRSEYDSAVKDILANKQVLAWILRGTTIEFAGIAFEDIIPLIEEPVVSCIPVDPGLTNNEHSKITGLPQESKINYEGVIYYDIRFWVRNLLSTDKKNFRIMVDLEAQKDETPGYDLVTRGIFYCGRMLSEQKDRTFTGNDYDSIEKVYSIWLCFNCSEKLANTISRYNIVHKAEYGTFCDNSRHDLIHVVMVRLPSEEKASKAINKPSELHRMLFDLIVRNMTAKDKIHLLNREYGLKLYDCEGRINDMCNLSEGIYEHGIKKGIEQGLEQGIELGIEQIITRMLDNGKTPEEINQLCGVSLEKIDQIQQKLCDLV